MVIINMYNENAAQTPPSNKDLEAWAKTYEFTGMMHVAADPDLKNFNALYPDDAGGYMGMMLLKPGSIISKLKRVEDSDIEAALPD